MIVRKTRVLKRGAALSSSDLKRNGGLPVAGGEEGTAMSVDGARGEAPRARVPRRWLVRERLVLTILRSPVMLLLWIFVICTFAYLLYMIFFGQSDSATEAYAAQESNAKSPLPAILFMVVLVLLGGLLLFSFTVVDQDGVHAYRFLIFGWVRHDFSWEDFRWGSYVLKTRARAKGATVNVGSLCVSQEWRSWTPEGESVEEFMRYLRPRRAPAKGGGTPIPGLQVFLFFRGDAMERVDDRWYQVIEWAEYKGYLHQGDTRPESA